MNPLKIRKLNRDGLKKFIERRILLNMKYDNTKRFFLLSMNFFRPSRIKDLLDHFTFLFKTSPLSVTPFLGPPKLANSENSRMAKRKLAKNGQ